MDVLYRYRATGPTAAESLLTTAHQCSSSWMDSAVAEAEALFQAGIGQNDKTSWADGLVFLGAVSTARGPGFTSLEELS